jgi:hypothetical protein
VFEIAKTDTGYASTPTTLASFCALTNCADGFAPDSDLMADAKGNLFGTTVDGGANGEGGTVFEITDSGFVVRPARPVYAGTPDTPQCLGNSASALAAERQAVEFGVEIGEHRGVVRVPRRVFQRFLAGPAHP